MHAVTHHNRSRWHSLVGELRHSEAGPSTVRGELHHSVNDGAGRVDEFVSNSCGGLGNHALVNEASGNFVSCLRVRERKKKADRKKKSC